MFFTDKNMLFLVEEEVRTHDSGFKLSGFRLGVQGHGCGSRSARFRIFFGCGD